MWTLTLFTAEEYAGKKFIHLVERAQTAAANTFRAHTHVPRPVPPFIPERQVHFEFILRSSAAQVGSIQITYYITCKLIRMTADTATDTDTDTATHLQIHPQDTLAANYKYSHECKDSHSQGRKHNKPIRIHRDSY